MSYQLGLQGLKRLIADQDNYKYFRAKLNAPLFKGEMEKSVFQFIDSHFTKYQDLPSELTIVEKFPEFSEVLAPEVSAYYLDKMLTRFTYDRIGAANVASQDILKADKNDVDAAMMVIETAISEVLAQRYAPRIMDFGPEAKSLLLGTYNGSLQSIASSGAFGWPYMDKMSQGILPGDVVSIVGRPAMGKAIRNDEKVLTLTGFKKNGDLKVGDKLASVDGRPNEVVGVYPQGKKKMYALKFQDGREIEASGDHLWELWYRDWKAPKVETTVQLIARLQKKRYQGRLSIRLFSGEFGSSDPLPVDPYVLGVLIGDGCFRSTDVRFSTEDPEIVQNLSNRLLQYQLVHDKGPDWRINAGRKNKLKQYLQEVDLWGRKSIDKFIPQEYLLASRPKRVELLKGLMDTDGTCEKSGTCTYCTVSPVLAVQVQELVRSLGGKSTVREKKVGSTKAFIVSAVLEDQTECFSLSRKLARVRKRTTHINHKLTIVGVEERQEQECTCIAVSHPDKLYVAGDYVVTHNTWFLLYIAMHNWTIKKLNVLFVSMEMNTLAIAQRAGAMYAGTNVGQLKGGIKEGYATPIMEKFIHAMDQLVFESAKFYVVDGNLAANPTDVFMLAKQLGCHMVCIDGAYLMRSKNPKLNKFDRVADNVELMKQLASDNEQSCVASWQFNRVASQKMEKKTTKVGLEDIGYSDAIGQISTVALALLQEEGVDTLETRTIDVMKGRNGEIGKFEVNWLFNVMDFSQLGSQKHAKIPQLQYLE